MIEVICPGCQSSYASPAQTAGTVFICQVCQGHVQVPAVALQSMPPEGFPAQASAPAHVTKSSLGTRTLALPPTSQANPGSTGAKTSRRWYYECDGEISGPVTEKQLRSASEEKLVKADSFVWSEGMGDWQPAYEALPRIFDNPNHGTSGWGIQKTVAVVLITTAVASLVIFGFFAFKGPKTNSETPAPSSKEVTQEPTPVYRGGPDQNAPERIGLNVEELGALVRNSRKVYPTEAVNILIARTKSLDLAQRREAVKALSGFTDPGAGLILLPLLDDTDTQIQQDASEALKQVESDSYSTKGLEGYKDRQRLFEEAIAKSLKGDKSNVKKYALNYYTTHTAKPEQYPDLLGAMRERDPETRKTAIFAINRVGIDNVPEAMTNIPKWLTDSDPEIAAIAYATAERTIGRMPRDERIAKTLEWFVPLLKSRDAGFRKRVIDVIIKQSDGIDKQSDSAKQLTALLLELTGDKDPEMQITALKALDKSSDGPEMIVALAKFLSRKPDPKADPKIGAEIRATAAVSILKMELLKRDSWPVLGEEGKKLYANLRECLDDPTANIRDASLMLIIIIGLDPKDARLLEQIEKLATRKEAAGKSSQTYALLGLAYMGEGGRKKLVQFVQGDGLALPEQLELIRAKLLILDIIKKHCKDLTAQEIFPLLLAAKDCHVKYYEKGAKDYAALQKHHVDLVIAIKDVLVKNGNDELSRQLRKTFTSQQQSKDYKDPYNRDYRHWLLTIIGDLNLDSLENKEKVELLDFMRRNAVYDPDENCKKLGVQLQNKLELLNQTKPFIPKK